MAAFYERDPADLTAAARMAAFPPAELVTVSVRMTRVLFAMLAQQRFDPPRRFPMPPPGAPDGAHAAALLGVKLTVRAFAASYFENLPSILDPELFRLECICNTALV